MNGICDQADWLEVERIRAGRTTLIRGNITNEARVKRKERNAN